MKHHSPRKSPASNPPHAQKNVGSGFFSLEHRWFPVILIFGLCFILYGNTLPHGLTIDDYYVTGEKSDVTGGIKSIPDLFTSRYHNFGKKNQFEYRPLVKISYAIEYQFFKNNPLVSHLVNLLLYACTGLLIFVLLRRFLRNLHPALPLLIAALFLAHPIHTEVVNSLKNRDEILSFLFGLLAMRSAVRFADTRKGLHILWSALFLSLAFLGKSSAVVFLFIIPAALLFFTDLKTRHILLVFGSLVLVLAAYRYLPRLYLPPSYRGREFYENPLLFEPDLLKKTATVSVILLEYLKLSFFPFPLLYYYGYNMVPVVDWSYGPAFASLVLFSGLGFLALALSIRKHPLGFAILFYLVTLSVFSNLLQPLMGIMADRFLHGAILGFCMVAGWFIFRWSGFQKAGPNPGRRDWLRFVALSLVLFIPYSAWTIERNTHWKDNFSLIKRDVQYADQSFIIQKAYANELQRQIKAGNLPANPENLQLIQNTYRKAISIYPYHPDPYKQLGQIHMGLREYEKAIPNFRRAIDLSPEKGAYNYYNLGICHSQLGQYDQAIGYLRRGTEILPEARGFYHLGHALARVLRFPEALEACTQCLRLNPAHKMCLLLRGSVYEAMKDYTHAFSDYAAILKRTPGDTFAMDRMKVITRKTGQEWKMTPFLERFERARKDSTETERGVYEEENPEINW